MPRVFLNDRQDRLAPYQHLVQELVSELKNTKFSHTLPLIYERVGPSKSIHVVVVWDKWEPVPSALRGAVILKSYEEADPEKVSAITLAMGVTPEEALELNLLPYRVEPMLRHDDTLTRENAIDLMKREGAIKTKEGKWVLAFPTEKLAEEVRQRLGKNPPSSADYWAVVTTADHIHDTE